MEAEMVSGRDTVVASVPSGKSRGSYEAAVISPTLALKKIDWVGSRIYGREFSSLQEFDDLLLSLDSTPNKQSLGGNLILALSIAFTKLLAKKGGMELFELIARLSKTTLGKFPLCFFNLIEGGLHAKNSLPFQEYLYIPQTDSPQKSLDRVMVVIKELGGLEYERFGRLKMGDEGGYTLPSNDPAEGLKILQQIKEKLGFREDKLSLDVAASTLFQNGSYLVGEKTMSKEDLLSYYQLLSIDYQLLSIEDPFEEKDWQGFEELNQKLGEKVWVVGDDLTTTNPGRIKEAYEKGAATAVIIKPTQVGTVSETIQAALLAKSYDWKVIVSHRSGETMDTFIADLAVGLGADGLKAGCPLQEERLVKYQRLLEIEEKLK